MSSEATGAHSGSQTASLILVCLLKELLAISS